MTAKELGAAALAIAALAVTAAVLIGDEEPPKGGDVVVSPTRLAVLRDGGKAYVMDVRTADGGVAVRLSATPGCVRRPAGVAAILCQRREPLPDGGSRVRDFGEDNRFPEAQAVGVGCEAVACGVMQGEDAAAKEDDVLRRLVDAGVLSRDGGGR